MTAPAYTELSFIDFGSSPSRLGRLEVVSRSSRGRLGRLEVVLGSSQSRLKVVFKSS